MAVKRKALSMETKFDIIQAVDSGRKKKDIAADFGIPPSTLSSILALREKILNSPFGSVKQDRKRFRDPSFPDIEFALLSWCKDAQANNLTISGSILVERANSLAIDIGHNNFKASNAWISRFKARNDIVCQNHSVKSASASTMAVTRWVSKLKSVMTEYAESDIYSVGESGLFYRMLPEQCLDYKDEKCFDGKKSKDRLTLILACNMDGSDKRNVRVIGKCMNSQIFKGVKYLPVDYRFNKKSFLTTSIFEDWLREFNEDMKHQKRNVLLILENCHAHKVTVKLDSVRLLYLPQILSSKMLPLNQGIISSLKTCYRTRIVYLTVLHREAQRKTVINVKSAINWVYNAWNLMDLMVIRNAFLKAGCVKDSCIKPDESLNENLKSDNPLELWDRLGVKHPRFEDFVSVDDGVQTASSSLTNFVSLQPDDGGGSSSEEEETAETQQLSSVESLDMVSKLKDYIIDLSGAKQEEMKQCLLALQKCEMLIMNNGVQKRTKFSKL